MNATEIETKIPHRRPMLLLDAIVSQNQSEIVCLKTFLADEPFVQGHFPGFPVVPGVILCECCMQAGAVLLAESAKPGSESAIGKGGVPLATRIDGVKFKRMVRPGDTVEIRATLVERLGSAYFMNGKVTVDGKLAARLDFACTIASASEAEGAHER